MIYHIQSYHLQAIVNISIYNILRFFHVKAHDLAVSQEILKFITLEHIRALISFPMTEERALY